MELLKPGSTNNSLDLSELSDEELVQKTLEDKSYFTYLINRYKSKLYFYVGRISNIAAEEIEDVLQDVFIKIYQKLRDFDQGLKFSSWIYRITRNQVIDNYRKAKARPQSIMSDEDEIILNNIKAELDLAEDMDRRYLKEKIGRALDKIDARYRDIIILKYFEEKDYAEISDILKKPTGTVASMLNKARSELKKQLARPNN